MNSEIALSSESVMVDPEKVYEIYVQIAEISVIPRMHEIYGQYCIVVDSELIKLQQSLYLDDYEASSGNIPDYIKHDITQYVGIPIDMSPEEIRWLLEKGNLSYWLDGFQNSSIQEVW